MKRRHQGHTKSLNEHLGPLRRYLDSQVGRPWNKVFRRSARTSTVLRPCRITFGIMSPITLPLTSRRSMAGPAMEQDSGTGGRYVRLDGLARYVCPRSGILKRVKPRKRSQNRRPKPPDAPRFVRVSDSLQCRLIDEVWHVVSLQPLPQVQEGKNGAEWDVVFARPASEIDFADGSQELRGPGLRVRGSGGSRDASLHSFRFRSSYGGEAV